MEGDRAGNDTGRDIAAASAAFSRSERDSPAKAIGLGFRVYLPADRPHFEIALRAARHILPAGFMHWNAPLDAVTGTLGKRIRDGGESEETGCFCGMNLAV
jgi:hypothetical protein